MPSQNLTSGQVLPGFYGFVDYNAQGGGNEPNLRLLIWGLVSAVAQRTPNQPFQPASQQEVDDGTGRGSDLANYYAAAIAQPEAQGCEVWCMPIVEPSGGVASTYKVTIFGTPTKPGTIQLWLGSQAVPAVGFTTSDTPTTIATALATQLNLMLDSPIGTVTSALGVVTIPYRHKGQTGEDFPIRNNISPNASGIDVSPAQLVFLNSAVGAGTVKVTFGAISVSTVLAGGETAAQVAAKVAASFNSDSYPMNAVIDGGNPAQVNLLFVNDKDVRRVEASIITTTGTTVNLGSGATSGAGSPLSFTYNGTQGTGLPSISSALTNLGLLGPFRSWASPWVDTTTIGAMATHIETFSDGSISGQKQQVLTLADFHTASVVGAIVAGTSPNLTATAPHYGFLWSPDCGVPAMELAVRAAAARAAKWVSAPQFNWNGWQLKGNSRKPIFLAPTIPSLDAQNTAIRTYALAPVIKGPSGLLEVVKGRSTSLAPDHRLWAWSSEAQAAYHATDLASYLRSLFQGGSIVRFSEPKAPGLFDVNSFITAVQRRLVFWETNGNYDGAEALGPSVKATPDPINPFRVNVEYPESPVLDLDQIVFTGHFTSPAQ